MPAILSDQKSSQEDRSTELKTLPLSEVKAKLSQLVDEVESRDERVVITRKGRPAAVLVSQDELESWQETLDITSDRTLMTEIRRGLRQVERGKTVGYEEVFGPKPPRKKRSARRAK
jgi:antitoxin YefM